jgi:hypothetical protein
MESYDTPWKKYQRANENAKDTNNPITVGDN